MTRTLRGLGLAAALLCLSLVVSRAQTQTTPTAAYVYIQIQGPQGSVYGFRASSSGTLSTISGSPFKPVGEIVGSTPTKFFTAGKDLLHAYALDSSGVIHSQIGQMAVFDYSGSECGSATSGQNGAVLDHSGQYMFVLLENGDPQTSNCTAFQSYKINSDGSFEFVGVNQIPDRHDMGTVSILGNEKFAYATNVPLGTASAPYAMDRDSAGALQAFSPFLWNTPDLNGGSYNIFAPDASPAANYLVLQLYPFYVNHLDPPQLASYTVASNGSISTTNTSSNMPTSALFDYTMGNAARSTFSPSGNMFTLYADNGIGNAASGIEIYNFNGAAPLTLYKTLLTGTPIDQVAWDSSNHMYAISQSENKLFVFTVTSTSVVEDSSWSIGSPFKMVVVSE